MRARRLLVWVQSGSAAVRIASGAQLARLHWSSGAILAIPPGVEFGLHADGEHDVTWIELDTGGSLRDGVARVPFVATAALVRPLLDTLWSKRAEDGVGPTNRQLQRLAELVRGRRHEPVGVLAAAIGLSPYHSCRAFKARDRDHAAPVRPGAAPRTREPAPDRDAAAGRGDRDGGRVRGPGALRGVDPAGDRPGAAGLSRGAPDLTRPSLRIAADPAHRGDAHVTAIPDEDSNPARAARDDPGETGSSAVRLAPACQTPLNS